MDRIPIIESWNGFKLLKVLSPQEQHLQWSLNSAESADSKDKYFETMKNPAKNNKGNIILTTLCILTENKTP